MVRTIFGKLIVLGVMMVLIPVTGFAASRKSSVHANIFKGTWKGVAVYEIGKGKGTKADLDITFGTGNFDKVSGICFLHLQPKGRLAKLNRNKREAVFTLIGRAGGKNYNVDFNSKFNRGYSIMTGTFRTRLGSGSFTLNKEGCTPDPKVLRGEWSGTCTWTGGKFKKKSGDMTLNFKKGTFDENAFTGSFFSDLFAIVRAEPGSWDPKNREITFVLVFKIRGRGPELSIECKGTFDDGFSELTGTFQSQRVGKGEFKVSRSKQEGKK